LKGSWIVRTGFKAPYIKEAAETIASGGFDLYGVRELEYAEAKSRLMEFKGIGNKVADCILLFAFGFYPGISHRCMGYSNYALSLF